MNGGGESASWPMIPWTTTNNPTTYSRSGGGCCFRSVQNITPTTIPNRIMLRFRPIAPKPATAAPVPSAPAATNSCNHRKKRKYVRARKSNDRSTKRKDTSSSSSSPSSVDRKSLNDVVTLQLLPENSQEKVGHNKDRNAVVSSLPAPRCNLDLTVATTSEDYAGRTDLVTVESVAEISSSSSAAAVLSYRCMDPEEAKVRLGGDKSPGFVSDGCNRVEWVNGAYRRMTGTTAAAAVRVRLEMKDGDVAAGFRRGAIGGGGAYTCWVKVRGDTWRKEMVPCDVWRLENGGLAWRLDVEAALTLGPG